MEINGIKLTTQGADMVVEVDAHGAWVEVIRERAFGHISHIVEELGMKSAVADAAEQASLAYLRASGGIMDASPEPPKEAESLRELLQFLHDVTLHLQSSNDQASRSRMFQEAYRLYVKWRCDKNNGDARFSLREDATE